VILLQETVARNQYDVIAFARQHQLFAYFVPVRESDRGTSGNAIVTTERPLDARAVVLPRIRRMRKAIVARFEIQGQPMFIVNAHLENRLSWLVGGLFADNARARQTQALLDAVPPGPGVVGGDLNTILGPDEPSLRMLKERFADTPEVRPIPTFHNRLVLDHLFFDLPEGWVATRSVIADRYDSDHHPVLGLVFSHRRFQ
jgi:endonuclease/exonuclease/phosphatase (EEP) superfamily protein YafD